MHEDFLRFKEFQGGEWMGKSERREIEKFMWTAKLLILALCFNIVIIKLSLAPIHLIFN